MAGGHVDRQLQTVVWWFWTLRRRSELKQRHDQMVEVEEEKMIHRGSRLWVARKSFQMAIKQRKVANEKAFTSFYIDWLIDLLGRQIELKRMCKVRWIFWLDFNTILQSKGTPEEWRRLMLIYRTVVTTVG